LSKLNLPQSSFNLSGVQLLWLLFGGLSLAALGLDWVEGRSFLETSSCFLPWLISVILTAGLGAFIVPILRRIKAGQVIREDGPQAHLKKAGTPTMGGIFILPVGLILALLWARPPFNPALVSVVLMTLAYGFIGWLDDWRILRRRSNKGISPRMKLLLQVGFGILFCGWMAYSYDWTDLTRINLPWGLSLPLGFLFWPAVLFVFTAESNATNLTDGLDGLAAGTGAIVLFGLGAFIMADDPALALICMTLSGSYLGFLVHNRNPAKVFMGDTGSLALGGALATVAILSNTLWVLFVMGGLFFLESLSVLAQVIYYKATKGPDGIGKRLLKMAPFHHHLELSGWSETQIVVLFYGVTSLLAIVCFLLPH
jgi:phospho-N-acetylmuramoyl-pentapeptide-transferase